MIPDEVLKEFNNRNVLVTGGSGLIGRQVVALLAEAGARIRSVSLDRITGRECGNRRRDLTNFEFCKEIVGRYAPVPVPSLPGFKARADIAVKLASHLCRP